MLIQPKLILQLFVCWLADELVLGTFEFAHTGNFKPERIIGIGLLEVGAAVTVEVFGEGGADVALPYTKTSGSM